MNPRICLIFCFAAILLASAPSVPGQTADTGALMGTLTDPSGVVVPNAVVTATSISTDQARTARSGADGIYKVTLLPPGDYQVRIEAAGFKSVRIPSVTIVVTEQTVLNCKLEAGASTEEVTIEAETLAIQTGSATTGSVVPGQVIGDLPLTVRNYTNLLSGSAGASAAVTNAADLGKGTPTTAVAGASGMSNNYIMDGAPVGNYSTNTMTEQGSFGSIGIPNPDSIREYKIQTSMADASYGRNVGAITNVVTKSGSNEFHGSAFWFLRNTVLNANDWFANRTNQKRGALNQHQFGGSFGGPVMKDKLFFFASFQETAQKNGLRSGMGSWNSMNLPLGDRGTCPPGATSLSECNAAAQAFVGALGTNYAGQQGFMRSGVSIAADGSNINPVALQILQLKKSNGAYYLPSPNGANTAPSISCDNSLFCTASVPAIYHEYQGIGNWDYLINTKQTLSGRYFVSVSPRMMSFVQGTTVPGIAVDTAYNNHAAVLKLTSVLSTNLANEVRASYQRNIVTNQPERPYTSSQVGSRPNQPEYDLLPYISIGNINFGTPTFQICDQATNQYQVADQLSWLRGKHSFRFGVEAGYIRWNWDFPGLTTGSLQFLTAADFLLGLPGCTPGDTTCSPTNPGATNGTSRSNINSTSGSVSRFIPGGQYFARRVRYFSTFAQDDIKLTPRLTVNMGLRWEYYGYPSELKGKVVNMNYALIPPDEIPQVQAPCKPDAPCPGSSLHGFTVPANWPNPIPAGVYQLTNNSNVRQSAPIANFAPRVGFAWQPLSTSRVAVRGGVGLFYDMPAGFSFVVPSQQSEPYAFTTGGTGPDIYYASLQTPYLDITPYWLPRWVTAGGLSSNILGSVMADSYPTPLSYTWNLSAQYEFLPSYVLELAYVGSHGMRQNTGYPLNAAVLRPASITGAAPITGNVALRVAALGAAVGRTANSAVGSSKYNGFQATVSKRLSQGVSFQGAYAWNRAFITGWQADSTIIRIDDSRFPMIMTYGLNPAYSPHKFSLQFSYDFPTLNLTGLAGMLLGGWKVTGAATIQNGRPMTITDGTLGTIFGQNGTNAQFCPGNGAADIATSGSTQERVDSYFNRSAFTGSACSAGGIPKISNGTGAGNAGSGIILGPGQHNWDLSLIKQTKVGGINEKAALEFRAQFFNAFNHPQFSNPGSANLVSGVFGKITNTSVNPRLIQFALKYVF